MNRKTELNSRGESEYGHYLLPVAVIALIAGSIARFWQLGGAPLAVDEYYFGSSILNIIERQLPEFACGGYYTRGLLIQYLTIPLIHFGATLEYATRFWPAVCSLITIAGVWRIGLLAGGRSTAFIAVILCSLSLWEVEFARFGRMYSPFQAIFVWYAYFQILHLIKGRDNARWLYLGLSGLAIFVYAGAALLLALNFLAVIWPGKRWSIGHLAAASGVLVAGMVDQSIDYRHLDTTAGQMQPGLTESFGSSLPVELPDIPGFTTLILATAVFLIAFAAWQYRRSFRAAHPSIIFWTLAAMCLCSGLVGLAIGLISAGYFMRLPRPSAFAGPEAHYWPAKLAALALLWIGIFFLSSAISGDNLWVNVSGALNYVFNYPDVYYKVVAPWIRTIPITSTLLGLFTVISLWSILVPGNVRNAKSDVLRYLFAATILLVLLVGILEQPYRTTRYTYFLYPIVLIVSSAGINYLAKIVTTGTGLKFLTAVLSIAVLAALSEDFRLDHLARINEPQFRFRTAYNARLAGHYYLRWDYREIAKYINDRLQANDSVVVFDQPATYYLARTSGVFIRKGTPIHVLTSACGGERHLWSNVPLLDQEIELRRMIDNTSGNTWLVMRTEIANSRDPLEASLIETYDLPVLHRSRDGNLAVYRLNAGRPEK